MTKNELQRRYFGWMYRTVCNEKLAGIVSYRKLLQHLNTVDFTFSIPMDGNRADDGVELRYRFGHEYQYEQSMIASLLDDRPCSILEMMVALAMRCEEHIMADPDAGNRTGTWFWRMLENMGLAKMSDKRYNGDQVDFVLSKFLDRGYKRNGDGGLFTVDDPRDMRSIEIWYQMCGYLDSIS